VCLIVSSVSPMWSKVKQFWHGASTYCDLGPDLSLRQRINASLQTRSVMTAEQWHDEFWRDRQVSPDISQFVYATLTKAAGLEAGCVLPDDRLEQDLHLTLICWFDWHVVLCEDFLLSFGVDLSDRLQWSTLVTIEDFVLFLNQQALKSS